MCRPEVSPARDVASPMIGVSKLRAGRVMQSGSQLHGAVYPDIVGCPSGCLNMAPKCLGELPLVHVVGRGCRNPSIAEFSDPPERASTCPPNHTGIDPRTGRGANPI